MKGIETRIMSHMNDRSSNRSDHCPAMKGIETSETKDPVGCHMIRSDHCPAMKGIETRPHSTGVDPVP